MSHFVQAWKGIPVWDLQTALRVCAAPDTSGLASVNPCWRRARCVRATAGKAPMAWSFSSAAIVEMAWPADQKKESETTVSAGPQPGTYTPVRDADTKCMNIHTHSHKTHTQQTNKSVTDTDKTLFSFAYTWDADRYTQIPNTKDILSCQSCWHKQQPDG